VVANTDACSIFGIWFSNTFCWLLTPSPHSLSTILICMRDFWNKWKVLSEKIGNFQAKAIFSLLFYILVTPIGLISNLFGDFLKKRSKPFWHEITENVSTIEKLKEQ